MLTRYMPSHHHLRLGQQSSRTHPQVHVLKVDLQECQFAPGKRPDTTTHKFPYTPTLVCFSLDMFIQRCGFHECASSPQISGIL